MKDSAGMSMRCGQAGGLESEDFLVMEYLDEVSSIQNKYPSQWGKVFITLFPCYIL